MSHLNCGFVLKRWPSVFMKTNLLILRPVSSTTKRWKLFWLTLSSRARKRFQFKQHATFRHFFVLFYGYIKTACDVYVCFLWSPRVTLWLFYWRYKLYPYILSTILSYTFESLILINYKEISVFQNLRLSHLVTLR